MPRFTLRLIATALGIATLAATVLSPALAGELPSGGVYVALGDSYTAGPLIVPQNDLFTCARSSSNYPGLLRGRCT